MLQCESQFVIKQNSKNEFLLDRAYDTCKYIISYSIETFNEFINLPLNTGVVWLNNTFNILIFFAFSFQFILNWFSFLHCDSAETLNYVHQYFEISWRCVI